jgi:CheY-like chemotaxis protein
MIRDIGRRIAGNETLQQVFARPLSLARRVRAQRGGQRGPKVYSLRAPEVECIGKGKAHRPYEFGVKVSVAIPLQCCKGGQFVAHVKALPGNHYDGHTLATIVPDLERQIGVNLQRVIADAGYRGHNAPAGRRLRVHTTGQKRGITAQIRRELRRRAAVEPVIGHLKQDCRMGRNYLAGRQGGAINPVLAAVGYNFRLLVAWLATFLRLIQNTRATVPLTAKHVTDDGKILAEKGGSPVVIVVDEDAAVLDSLKFLLEGEGYKVDAFISALEPLEQNVPEPACVIVDQHMPHMTGLELTACLRAAGRHVPILLITGVPSQMIMEEAAALGVDGVLEKPPNSAELLKFAATHGCKRASCCCDLIESPKRRNVPFRAASMACQKARNEVFDRSILLEGQQKSLLTTLVQDSQSIT